MENLDVDGGIVLKLAFKMWDGGMDWIDLAQNKDSWPSLVIGVINLRVYYEEFLD